MITGIILTFFGTSCFASVIVFAACAASARADQIQHEAFNRFYDDSSEQFLAEGGKQLVGNTQLALNS